MTCYVEKTNDTKFKFNVSSIANKFRIYKKSKNNSLKNKYLYNDLLCRKNKRYKIKI